MTGRPLTRRTAVISAAGATLAGSAVLVGCDVAPPGRESAPRPASAPPPEDSALVAEVVVALVVARSVIEAATLAVPELTLRLAPVADAHAAHLDVLNDAAPSAAASPSAPPTIGPRPAGALAAVARSEQRLLRTVRRGCVEAASGDLARVLASIAASTAQHATALASQAQT